MKSGFCAAAFVSIFMFLAATPAHPSDIVLLNSDGDRGGFRANAESALQSRCPDVLRQRAAFLNADELSNRQNVESIQIQLFDDARVIASQAKVRRVRNGSLLWTGKIAGVEDSQIVLVVQNRNIFASIYLPSSIYQIRPARPAIAQKGAAESSSADAGGGAPLPYIIRELKSGWKADGHLALVSHDGSLPDQVRVGQVLQAEERKIIELVNLERAAERVPILQYNDRLAAVARDHAQDMALHDYGGHDRRDGRKFWQSVFDSGYPVSKCGENIAVGQVTPEEAFECLISSPGHRANIIDSDFNQIGVAHAVNPASTFHHFWAQEFGAGNKRELTSRLEAAHSPLGLFAENGASWFYRYATNGGK